MEMGDKELKRVLKGNSLDSVFYRFFSEEEKADWQQVSTTPKALYDIKIPCSLTPCFLLVEWGLIDTTQVSQTAS